MLANYVSWLAPWFWCAYTRWLGFRKMSPPNMFFGNWKDCWNCKVAGQRMVKTHETKVWHLKAVLMPFYIARLRGSIRHCACWRSFGKTQTAMLNWKHCQWTWVMSATQMVCDLTEGAGSHRKQSIKPNGFYSRGLLPGGLFYCSKYQNVFYFLSFWGDFLVPFPYISYNFPI